MENSTVSRQIDSGMEGSTSTTWPIMLTYILVRIISILQLALQLAILTPHNELIANKIHSSSHSPSALDG